MEKKDNINKFLLKILVCSLKQIALDDNRWVMEDCISYRWQISRKKFSPKTSKISRYYKILQKSIKHSMVIVAFVVWGF